jgi:hypothetical protein
MVMPNFLIIGAAKSGTTSLYHYLKEHPQVYMSPIKETRFFALGLDEKKSYTDVRDQKLVANSVHSLEAYQDLFKNVSNEVAIGEDSPLYLYHAHAAERIKKMLPDVRLIAILRNPADRAFSHFIHSVRINAEPLKNFAEALEAEPLRNGQNIAWSHYFARGLYYEQVKRYFDLFDKEQIKIYVYDDLRKDPVLLMQDIYRFLGINDTFLPNTTLKHGVGGTYKSALLPRLVESQFYKTILGPMYRKIPLPIRENFLQRYLTNPKPTMPPDIRRQLVERYRDDILKLQDLLSRDLSVWLQE